MKYSFRFVIVAGIFIACLLTANIIAVKVISVGPVILPAAVIIFPISYIFGDVLTEVYGYRMARRIIWLGFGCNMLMVVFIWFGQLLPAASFWEDQPAYNSILGYTPRLLVASFLGYLIGEFANSFVLARMKILTKGRWLWTRTIGSTFIGQALDSAVFLTIAYIGISSNIPFMILCHWSAKVLIETVATPFTYWIVGVLKRVEAIDTYDYRTNFNPFLLKE